MRQFLSILLICTSLSLSATDFQLSIGARGGGATYLPKGQLGVNTGIDLGFAFLWPVNNTALGFRTGISGMYSTASIKTDILDNFVNYDCYGLELDYTVSGNLRQAHRQLQVGIPLMLTGRRDGFVFSLGVRPMYTLLAKSTQDMTDLHISVYYPEFDVTIDDEHPHGVASQEQLHQSRDNVAPVFSLFCGLELGYEWRLNTRYRSYSSDRMGLVFYCDVAAYSTPFRCAQNNKPFIHVSEIVNEQEDAVVTIPYYKPSSAHPMDFGIKFYYAYTISTHKEKCRCYF